MGTNTTQSTSGTKYQFVSPHQYQYRQLVTILVHQNIHLLKTKNLLTKEHSLLTIENKVVIKRQFCNKNHQLPKLVIWTAEFHYKFHYETLGKKMKWKQANRHQSRTIDKTKKKRNYFSCQGHWLDVGGFCYF